MKQTLVVSFSGGKTSGFMCKWLIDNFNHLYDFVFLFSNTGREHEKTLEFVNRCDIEFGLNLVWLEAVVNPEHGKGIRHRVVNYQTASRNGEPFESFIAKSGIPNASYPQCSDRLKTFVIESYKRDNGLTGCLHALGMRADEPKRIKPESKAVKRYNLVYPLAQWGSFDKQDVNDWWEEQSFNLEIPPHHGNCVTCWKKTDSKLFRIAHEHPEWFAWDMEMERKYQGVKPNTNGVPRVFFRKNRSAIDILKAAKVTDLSILIHVTETDQDVPGGCGESCEAYQMDDDDYADTPYITLYHNGSTQPVGQSFQADPWCLGEPDQVAGGLRIWNVDDDLRIVASVTPLQLTEPPALRYADEDDNLTEDEPE